MRQGCEGRTRLEDVRELGEGVAVDDSPPVILRLVRSLGFRVWGLGFGDLGFGSGVWGLGLGVWVLGSWVFDYGFWVLGSGFRA